MAGTPHVGVAGLVPPLDTPHRPVVEPDVDRGRMARVEDQRVAPHVDLDLDLDRPEPGHVYDGLIGDAFLRGFTVTYDVPGARMIFTPRR